MLYLVDTSVVELLGHDGIICPVVNVTALTCFVELLGHDGIICPVVNVTALTCFIRAIPLL